jgi:hypothetical protein
MAKMVRRRRREERPPVKLAIVFSIDGGGGGDERWWCVVNFMLLAVGKGEDRERPGERRGWRRQAAGRGSKSKGSLTTCVRVVDKR